VRSVLSVLHTALTIFWVILIIRLIMEWVMAFARSFRPSGPLAVALEIVYTVTDPPLKALRRIIPPLRLGQISLDLAFIVLFILVTVLRGVVAQAALNA
jgi:YggT family protein